MSRDNIYEVNIDLWGKQKHSSESIASKLEAAQSIADIKAIVSGNTWITDLSDEEAQIIMDGDGSSYKREGAYNAVISKRLLVGWSGHGHSAVDVGVWAYGPIADQVKGQIDNTQIALASAEIIGVDLKKATAELQSKYLYPKFKVSREKEVLYPAKALVEALGGTYTSSKDIVTIVYQKNTMDINLKTNAIQFNGKNGAFTVDVDNNTLYFPLTAFNQLSGKNMKWDTLSERLLLK